MPQSSKRTRNFNRGYERVLTRRYPEKRWENNEEYNKGWKKGLIDLIRSEELFDLWSTLHLSLVDNWNYSEEKATHVVNLWLGLVFLSDREED